MSTKKRVDLKAILRDPEQRKELMVTSLMAAQAREGIETTREQAEEAYDKVQAEDTGEPLTEYFITFKKVVEYEADIRILASNKGEAVRKSNKVLADGSVDWEHVGETEGISGVEED